AELAGSHPSVRSIIVMDEDERVDDDLDQIAAARAELVKDSSKARLTTLDQLVAAGAYPTRTPLPPCDESGDRVVQLMPSSGTTGTPKGAMLDERYMKAYLNRQVPGVPVVVLSFAPMGHSAGRGRVYSTLLRGGSVYFVAKPDMSTVFDDLRLVRPT